MKIIIEIPDTEIQDAVGFMTCLPEKAKTIQLTVGNNTQAEFKFKSISMEHKPKAKKEK